VLSLQNAIGTYYDMNPASPSSSATYTIAPNPPTAIGGFARVLINRASQPTVGTGAVLIKGDAFISSANMYMTVQWNGFTSQYWFEQIAP